MNFNPIIYLGNLNILRKEEPSINEDIEKLEKHIDDNLKPFCNKSIFKYSQQSFRINDFS